MPGEALRLIGAVARPRAESAGAERLSELVTTHFGFVWRSLVRLGVPRSDAEDALQQIFIVASRRLEDIEPGRERAFLFATALRLASRDRRTRRRRREVFGEDVQLADPTPSPEEIVDRGRARAACEAVLASMPLDLRAVFVLFELEQLTSPEIAALLELPLGTVASRLRRARDHFQAEVKRMKARGTAPRDEP